MTDKKELRARLKALREAITEKEEKSLCITDKLLGMPEVKNAHTLLVFYPKEGEINLLPIAEYGWREGKRVGFPLCEDKNGRMSFRLVGSVSELHQGSFGTMEPSKDAPEISPHSGVIFLPALAIDKKGYRIGYGKGYYDRYLAKHAHENLCAIGVIYKDLIFDELPRDKHDIPCRAVVSED